MNRHQQALSLLAILVASAILQGLAEGQDTAALRSEVERLQTEYNTLNDVAERQEQLLADVKALSQELPQQRQTIQEMNARLNRLKQIERELKIWATASLVLGNQRTSGAAALRETESGYQIVAVAKHPFQQYAVAAAMQGRVPCRADARSTRLLDQIASEESNGNGLPLMASEELNVAIAEVIALRPVNETGPQFMVFHDPVSGEQKVAVIQASSEGHSVSTIDKAMEQLARSAYSGGSVWIGNQEEIEPHLEIGAPFVDYCTLAILHALGHDDHQRKNVCISIKPKLDSSLVSTSPEHPNRRANRYLKDESTTEGILALGRELHDEFYKRLIRLNIPVLEREHEDVLRGEDSASGYGAITSHLAQATHTVVIEVDKTPDGADRVSVRLSDVASSQSIWAANDSRSMMPNRNWKNYVLHSGVPAVAEFHSESSRAEIEKLLASEGLITERTAKKYILVNEGQFGDSVRFRTLYGLRTVDIPASDVTLTNIVSAPGQRVQADTENTTGKQILHYAAWRMARHVAPPAVRLPASSHSSNHRVRILPLGSSNHLQPGSRFRLLCRSQQDSESALFPACAVLSEVLDQHSSRVILPGSQTTDIPALHNAIAVCDSWDHYKVAVMPPVVPLKLRQSLKKQQELKSRGYDFGRAFQNSLIETLSPRIDCTGGIWHSDPRAGQYWDMAIDRKKTLEELKRHGITHIICGELESVSTHTVVHFGLSKLDRDRNNEVVEGPVIDSVRVLLAQSDL